VQLVRHDRRVCRHRRQAPGRVFGSAHYTTGSSPLTPGTGVRTA
jgi:hypothetical protein